MQKIKAKRNPEDNLEFKKALRGSSLRYESEFRIGRVLNSKCKMQNSKYWFAAK